MTEIAARCREMWQHQLAEGKLTCPARNQGWRSNQTPPNRACGGSPQLGEDVDLDSQTLMKPVTHSVGTEEINPKGRQPMEHTVGRLPSWGPTDGNDRTIFFFSSHDIDQPPDSSNPPAAAPFLAPAALLNAYQPQGSSAGSPSSRQGGARAPEPRTEREAQHSSPSHDAEQPP